MRIALYGFMGAGKSSLGRELAAKLQYGFIDLDREVEKFSQKTIIDIFKTDGEITFRKLEHRVLKEVIKQDRNNIILSLGGGTIIQPTNRQLLDIKAFKKIFLNVNLQILINRLKNDRNSRPLLKNIPEKDLEAYIKALYESRKMIYEKHADIIININDENFKMALAKLYAYFNVN